MGSSDSFTNFEFRIYEFFNEYLLWLLFQLESWEKKFILDQLFYNCSNGEEFVEKIGETNWWKYLMNLLQNMNATSKKAFLPPPSFHFCAWGFWSFLYIIAILMSQQALFINLALILMSKMHIQSVETPFRFDFNFNVLQVF